MASGGSDARFSRKTPHIKGSSDEAIQSPRKLAPEAVSCEQMDLPQLRFNPIYCNCSPHGGGKAPAIGPRKWRRLKYRGILYNHGVLFDVIPPTAGR